MTDKEIATANVIELLEQGRLELLGLVPWGSNYTFLARVCSGRLETNAIYKPRQGERPLWDFDRGTLCQRERAAFLISEALRWQLVPPTILRDGPHGWGAVQYYVEHDTEQHYFTIEGQYSQQLQKIALFDIVINNADRKGGHVLVTEGGRLWAIDHGVCFHSDYKLRSVIWEFAGTAIPHGLCQDLARLQAQLCQRWDPLLALLGQLLTGTEIEALKRRLARLIEANAFPEPGPGRHYPWPLV